MITKDTFSSMLMEILDVEDTDLNVTEDTKLEELDFDSVTKLGVLALLDTYSDKAAKVQALQSCKTIGDIMNLVEFE
ncbi:hypothetical protein KIH86_13505 [Paenibacillus sp. HN-1]|uniref:hypothetical protein n=1 Tax=Paenibacillus TaxID=44249 RepID=UPI001CA8E677|nr:MULTISPECIES: hypothetical protein [Paenibacillus]MBY9080764.1 hypothetical protein [Paenibacillus sp. CGMCC 1.18879]MBY9085244.1 hypothetical protein [Paenibacillus sinensis]